MVTRSPCCCRIDGGTCNGDFQLRASPLYLCAYCCCSVVWLIIIILIAVSFEYVNYNEMAFGKNSISNKVNTEEVYSVGRHMVGPTVSMVRFPRQYQPEAFTGDTTLRVFNKFGMEISVEVFFQYRIKEDSVQSLMTAYGTNYDTKLRSVAESTLKNTAVLFSVFQYRNNRTVISEEFNKNVTVALEEMFIDLEESKLQIGRIILPGAQMTKFMDDAIVKQDAFRFDFEQEAKLIRDQTDREVKRIGANATFIERSAAANASRIVEEAQAEAERIIADAYGTGWLNATEGLGIEDPADRAEFFRLLGILDNPSSPQLIDKDLEVIIQSG